MNPSKGYMPQCYLELSLKNIVEKEVLFIISDNFKELTISLIEYALNFKFNKIKTNIKVRNLFMLFVKYMYIAKQKQPILYYTPGQNFTYYFGKNKKIKLYERGSNNIKDGAGWNYKDINSLRMEVTLKKKDLKYLSIESFESFLSNCKIFEVFDGKINFSKFKENTKKLPKEWELYGTNFKEFQIDSFQKIYNDHQKANTVKNLTQSIEFDEAFCTIKNKILKKLSKFDAEWKCAESHI